LPAANHKMNLTKIHTRRKPEVPAKGSDLDPKTDYGAFRNGYGVSQNQTQCVWSVHR
jgi:hypothetical protein